MKNLLIILMSLFCSNAYSEVTLEQLQANSQNSGNNQMQEVINDKYLLFNYYKDSVDFWTDLNFTY